MAQSVDLTASQTIGFFKFLFAEVRSFAIPVFIQLQPLYFKLDGQCLPNTTCSTQTVQDCCFECTDNNGLKVPYPLNPLNPPNCYCAQSVQSVCIDLKYATILVLASSPSPPSDGDHLCRGTYSQYSDAARLLNGYSSSAHHQGSGTAGGGMQALQQTVLWVLTTIVLQADLTHPSSWRAMRFTTTSSTPSRPALTCFSLSLR